MARNAEKKPIACQYFTWRLFQRRGVWYADGRGKQDLGKHSLGTKNREVAIDNLKRLDQIKAIEQGIAKQAGSVDDSDVSIDIGWNRFLEHCNRPEVLGGVSQSTSKRYRAVRDKHTEFCSKRNIATWSGINKREAEKYGGWLNKCGYAARTIYLELTLIVSVSKWLADENLIPELSRFNLSIRRPQGTNTYCYTQKEVSAIIEHCRDNSDLDWLEGVVLALACTGVRIGELASLRFSDVNFEANTIRIADERGSSRHIALGTERRTKGGRSRAIPISPPLRTVLTRLKRNPDGRLFHGPRGGKLKPDTVRNIFVREVITPLKNRFSTPSGEIGFEHGRLHSFRHYFVSQAFLGGASEGEIMEWVGHSDSKMVAHYRHLKNEDSQRKMQQLDFLGVPDGPDKVHSQSTEVKEGNRSEDLAQSA